MRQAKSRSAQTARRCVVSDHRQYRWYRVGDWKLIRSLPRQLALNPGHIAYSPDGRLLALAGPACSVDLIEASTGEELATLQTPAAPFIIESIRFSRDSKKLIVTGSLASIIVWDLPSVRAKLASMNLDWK